MEEECDIVIVGAGGAGLAAACAAAELGSKVVVLEQLDALRGTTSQSVGSFAAAGTRLQRRAGFADSPDAFAEDIAKAHAQSPDTDHLRRMLADQSGPTLEWLEQMGVVFVGPFPEPPNRVPRMHNAVPTGKIYLAVMAARARDLGVKLRFNCRVHELPSRDGIVVGVRYVHRGADVVLHARSVILASGDYSGSAELRSSHLSRSAAAAIPINEHNRGEGHELAIRAGAAMKRMDGVFGPQLRFVLGPHASWFDSLPSWRWWRRLAAVTLTHAPRPVLARFARQLLVAHMSPVPAMFQAGAVMVDNRGELVNANSDAASELALRPSATGFIIGDAMLAERFRRHPNFISTAPGVAFAYFGDYERGRPDLVHWAEDSEGLARRLGLDAILLAHATSNLRGRLFALGPVKAMLTVTEGGAATDERCQVLNAKGNPIPGLYAAGGVGQGGLMLKGHGLHLAWAITSGRVAGMSAARTTAR